MDNEDLLQNNPHISDPDKEDDLFEEFSAYFSDDEAGPSALLKAFVPEDLQQQMVSMLWQAFNDGNMAGDD